VPLKSHEEFFNIFFTNYFGPVRSINCTFIYLWNPTPLGAPMSKLFIVEKEEFNFEKLKVRQGYFS
jgi:hypothetical protein